MNEREESVRELVGIRESVSDELKSIVSDANAGLETSNVAAKASALYLMGRWGLLQCRDVLQAESKWAYYGQLPPRFERNSLSIGRMRDKLGAPAALSLARIAASDRINLAPSRVKTDLKRYPVLARAITDLRSLDYLILENAEDSVDSWYRCVAEGLQGILLFNRTHLYSDDVKITAAFLAGEYRVFNESAFLDNIDLRDEKNLTGGYPSSLSVETPDSAYPSVVALIKCGHRISTEWSFRKLAEEDYPQESRERIARALVRIDPVLAKKQFDDLYTTIDTQASQTPKGSAMLSRLSSVRSIIE